MVFLVYVGGNQDHDHSLSLTRISSANSELVYLDPLNHASSYVTLHVASKHGKSLISSILLCISIDLLVDLSKIIFPLQLLFNIQLDYLLLFRINSLKIAYFILFESLEH